ncbi:DUF368 domain-containing protein [Halopseudomonas pachastrellae]|nr:DUF368 domain-containing protein [Halopseudomonas pachastrellae]
MNVFLGGCIAICAMILPGISGSLFCCFSGCIPACCMR